MKDQRKIPEPYNREPDYDGYRSKKQRPSPPVVNPSTDHLSGTNADDPVYYDDVFIDDVGEDYKDHNLVLLLSNMTLFIEIESLFSDFFKSLNWIQRFVGCQLATISLSPKLKT